MQILLFQHKDGYPNDCVSRLDNKHYEITEKSGGIKVLYSKLKVNAPVVSLSINWIRANRLFLEI